MTTDNKALIAEAADLAKVWRARGPAVDLAHRTLALIDSVAALATAGTQLSARPDRDTLANKLDEALSHTYVPFPELVEAADALLAAPDLWQPAPVIDRAALEMAAVRAMVESAEVPTGVRGVLLGEVFTIRERVDADVVAHVVLDALPASGWQPASPRTVSTVEELDALPVGSVILSSEGSAYLRADWLYGALWLETGFARRSHAADVALPASVLYVPSSGVATEPTGDEGVES